MSAFDEMGKTHAMWMTGGGGRSWDDDYYERREPEKKYGRCDYCGRYGPLGKCEGCGASNKPVK